MNTRKGWGMIAVAVVFAIFAIGTALGTVVFEQNGAKKIALESGANPDDMDGDGLATWEELVWRTDPARYDTDEDGVSDGVEIAAGTDPTQQTSSDEGVVLSEYAPTVSLIRNVYAATPYIIDSENTLKQKNVVIDTVIANSVQELDLEERIPLSALRIGTSTSLSAYADLTSLVLRQATQVRTHELITFRDTIDNKEYNGTPELKRAATVYKQIEAALLVMEVPPRMASEHLSLINSLGSLANTVNAMSTWQGDPLQGLLYIDAFIQKEAEIKKSMTALFKKLKISLTAL